MNQALVFDKSVFLRLAAELGETDTHEVLAAFMADTANNPNNVRGSILGHLSRFARRVLCERPCLLLFYP